MYVMILNGKLHMSKLQKLVSNRMNGKLHTSKLQKLVSNRIFHKEEKERKVLDIYPEVAIEMHFLSPPTAMYLALIIPFLDFIKIH